MVRRVLLLALVLLALGAGEAQAHITITCEPCSHPYQRWADEAAAPTPDISVAVVEGPNACPGPVGDCTDGSTIWMNEPDPYFARDGFLHELGHVFDQTLLPEWARSRFRVLSRHLTMPWTDPGLSEEFAETYRECAWPQVRREDLPISGLRRSGALPAACRLIRHF